MRKIIFILLFSMFFSININTFADQKINDGEKFIYKITGKDGKSFTGKSAYHVSCSNGKIIYSYLYISDIEKFDVKTDENGKPIEIIYEAKGNIIKLIFNGLGKTNMKGYWHGNKLDKEGYFLKNVTLENALVIRTMDLNSKEKYVFDLLQIGEFPKLIAYRMYFQVIGEETITVKAGSFRCKKVIFSLCDWRGFFYKAYYYISDDQNKYIVKIDNVPMGGTSELIKVE